MATNVNIFAPPAIPLAAASDSYTRSRIRFDGCALAHVAVSALLTIVNNSSRGDRFIRILAVFRLFRFPPGPGLWVIA